MKYEYISGLIWDMTYESRTEPDNGPQYGEPSHLFYTAYDIVVSNLLSCEAVEMTSRGGFYFNLVHIAKWKQRQNPEKHQRKKERLRWTSKRAKLFLTEWSCRLSINLWRTDWGVTFVIIRMNFHHSVIYKLKFRIYQKIEKNKNKILCLIAFLAACDPEDIFVSSIYRGGSVWQHFESFDRALPSIHRICVRVIKLYLTILTTLLPFEWRPHRRNSIQKHHVHTGHSNVFWVSLCVSIWHGRRRCRCPATTLFSWPTANANTYILEMLYFINNFVWL